MTDEHGAMLCPCGHLVIVHASPIGNAHWVGCFMCTCYRVRTTDGTSDRSPTATTATTPSATSNDL